MVYIRRQATMHTGEGHYLPVWQQKQKPISVQTSQPSIFWQDSPAFLPDAPLNHGNVPPILYESRTKLNRIYIKISADISLSSFFTRTLCPSKIILRVGRSVTVSVKVTLLTSYLVCLFVCMFVSPFDQYMDNIENLIACRKKCVFCVKTYRLPVLYRV